MHLRVLKLANKPFLFFSHPSPGSRNATTAGREDQQGRKALAVVGLLTNNSFQPVYLPKAGRYGTRRHFLLLQIICKITKEQKERKLILQTNFFQYCIKLWIGAQRIKFWIDFKAAQRLFMLFIAFFKPVECPVFLSESRID